MQRHLHGVNECMLPLLYGSVKHLLVALFCSTVHAGGKLDKLAGLSRSRAQFRDCPSQAHMMPQPLGSHTLSSCNGLRCDRRSLRTSEGALL